jgi:hypothetical protein
MDQVGRPSWQGRICPLDGSGTWFEDVVGCLAMTTHVIALETLLARTALWHKFTTVSRETPPKTDLQAKILSRKRATLRRIFYLHQGDSIYAMADNGVATELDRRTKSKSPQKRSRNEDDEEDVREVLDDVDGIGAKF